MKSPSHIFSPPSPPTLANFFDEAQTTLALVDDPPEQPIDATTPIHKEPSTLVITPTLLVLSHRNLYYNAQMTLWITTHLSI